MDLSAYSLPKMVKEKRERQPNWTEHEKQLLISLTRYHQSILENKGSDALTLKRKSDAWNDIAQQMNAAGYNRSKERLKQQLGRIRSAEAKRAKEALERPLPVKFNRINTSFVRNQTPDCISSRDAIIPSFGREELHIKAENTFSIDDESNGDALSCQSPPMELFNAANNDVEDKMHNFKHSLQLQDTHSLCQTATSKEHISMETSPAKADFDADLPDSANTDSLNVKCPPMVLEENNGGNVTTTSPRTSQRKPRVARSIRLASSGVPSKKQQRLRQIHMYRIAVERERLRALKIQQKRDRILHRKDVEIQNLKLQILRNITNQTRDGNRIDF